jgi:hypothetical protein
MTARTAGGERKMRLRTFPNLSVAAFFAWARVLRLNERSSNLHNWSQCVAAAAPGPSACGIDGTGDRRELSPPRAPGGDWFACGPCPSIGPHTEITRAPSGIPLAQKWPSPRIMRRCGDLGTKCVPIWIQLALVAIRGEKLPAEELKRRSSLTPGSRRLESPYASCLPWPE